MISLMNLSMGFSQRTLFKDVSLSIFPNEKIGLTGPNGAGKSTLFEIIRGELEPVAGEVQIQKNIHIGYLPQEAHFTSDKTVIQELTEGDARIEKLQKERRELEEKNLAATDRYGDVLEELDQLGIYDLEHKAEKILMGLGFKEEDFDKPITNLSGGWQMRTLLAKLLTHDYNLLLLDEPTNYLDLEATLWLKDYLRNYPNSFVLISHDRVFLNDVTNYTIVLDQSRMDKVKGNYEDYEENKETMVKTLEKKQKVIEKKRKQLERFTQRFHAQPNRASAVKNKRKMIERLESIELPKESKSVGSFSFDDVQGSGYVVINGRGLAKSYGEKKVYENLDLEIIRGQKVCLVGPNGAGKSTLLKMIAGVLDYDKGEMKLGHQVERGYFSQTRLDVLHPNKNVLEELASAAPDGTQTTKMRTLLGVFNFHGDDVFKPVGVLSGGEKSRLILAKLLIDPPNFMLLDEPTTHLDLDGIKALTTALKSYTGTMCFISHDLYFIREVADNIYDVDNGAIKIYPGGLDYYLEKKKGIIAEEVKKEKQKQQAIKEQQKNKPKQDQDNVASGVKNAQKQHREAKKRVNQIKTQIKNLDKEVKELELESYVKSRKMAEMYQGRDADLLKEYGQRLKDIQTRLREIESTKKKLLEEKNEIEK